VAPLGPQEAQGPELGPLLEAAPAWRSARD